MAFDPSKFTPSYGAGSVAAPVAAERKGFDPASFVPIAPSDAAVQTNFWNKFKTGLMDAVDTYNYQVGSGVRGMLQLVTPNDSAFGKGIKERQHSQEKLAEKARTRSPSAALAGDVAGIGTDIASKLAMGGGIAAGAKAVLPQLGEAIASGMAASPRLGAIAQQAALGGAYGTTQYAEDAQDRLKNAAIGAAIGGAGEGIVQGAKAGASKLLNRPVAEAKEILEKGKGTLGQVLNRESVQKVEQGLADIPLVGTKSSLVKQRQALEDITKSFAEKVKEKAPQLATKAPEGAGEGAAHYIKQTASKLEDKTSALYTKFEQEAGKITTKMELSNTQEAAKRLLASQTGIFKLPGGDDVMKVAETLSQTKALHPSLLQQANKFLSTAYEKTVKVSATAARDILQVKNALNTDMGLFANKQGGRVADLYNKAAKFAAENQMPYKNNALVDKVLSGKLEPEKVVGRLLKADQPELVRQIMKPMSQEGRGNLRNSMLTSMYEKATKATGEFDSVAYSKDLDKLMTTMKGSLNKSQYKELEGIQKLFKATNAGQQALKTAGGKPNYFAVTGAAAGAVASPAMTGALLGGIAGVSKMLTSPAIGRMLIKLADTSAPAAQATIRQSITKALIKKSATSTTISTARDSNNSPLHKGKPDYKLKDNK